jgi:chromosome segregation ATPase
MLLVADTDIVRGATVAVVTVVVVIVALLVAGIVLLFRRRDGARPSSASGIEALTLSANAALVRADESLASARDELGFAVAQFGDTRTAAFSATVDAAADNVTRAFRIKQQLEDEYPESAQKRRELTLQVVALVDTAQKKLDAQQIEFTTLRSQEVNAPASLESLQRRISDAAATVPTAQQTLDDLTSRYSPALTSALVSAPVEAQRNLDAATASAQAASARVSPTGVNAVAADLASAERSLHEALGKLEAIDRVARELAAASAALDSLVASTATDLAEARREREAAPDDVTRSAIIAAIADVDRVSASVRSTDNPVAALDQLGAAIAGLDTALASARNQTERLSHARTALTGALVAAKSQISVAQSAGGGADARTRLAEAKRQLQLAEVESDPVEALDAARRAATHARDAEALAHYRQL